MPRPLIVCTRALDPAAMAALARLGRVRTIARGAPPAPARLRAAARGAVAVVGTLVDRFDAAFFAATPRLRILALDSAGHDNVDLTAARAAGVTVTHTPGVLTDATADLTLALLLACARRLPAGAALVRGGGFLGWDHNLLVGADLRGRTLGILGMGRIGRAVAARARGFGMRIVFHSRRPLRVAGARRVALPALLARADFLTLHCPLTAETRGVISAAALRRMKPGAILINTARGACVDETAVAAALRSGRLAAAGFDVFAGEPRLSAALRGAPNCLVLPHLGSATRGTRAAMGRLVVANVRAALAGKRPPARISA